jgi:hypothetical protein
MIKYIIFGFLILSTACQRKGVPARVDKLATTQLLAQQAPNDSLTLLLRLQSAMTKNIFLYDNFSAKMKIEITKLDDNTSFAANIRMKKDSAIWVSISPALGIEAVRVLLRPDSIFMIDRIHKKGFAKPYSHLKTLGIPFDFISLQAAIVGNPIYYFKTKNKAFNSEQSHTLITSSDTMRSSFEFEKTELNITKIIIDEIAKHRSITYAMSNYEMLTKQKETRKIATTRQLKYSELPNQTIDLEVNNVKWDETSLSFPFTFPDNYTIEK